MKSLSIYGRDIRPSGNTALGMFELFKFVLVALFLKLTASLTMGMKLVIAKIKTKQYNL